MVYESAYPAPGAPFMFHVMWYPTTCQFAVYEREPHEPALIATVFWGVVMSVPVQPLKV